MIYEYKCIKCNHIQEEEHTMLSSPKVLCDSCGGSCMKIISGGTGFILSGAGWGKDGYDKNAVQKKGKTNE